MAFLDFLTGKIRLPALRNAGRQGDQRPDLLPESHLLVFQ